MNYGTVFADLKVGKKISESHQSGGWRSCRGEENKHVSSRRFPKLGSQSLFRWRRSGIDTVVAEITTETAIVRVKITNYPTSSPCNLNLQPCRLPPPSRPSSKAKATLHHHFMAKNKREEESLCKLPQFQDKMCVLK